MRKIRVAGILGMEGGGTSSVALLATIRGTILSRVQAGPCNIQLLRDEELLQRFKEIHRALDHPHIARAALCLAGCRTDHHVARIQRIAIQTWPEAEVLVADDSISGLIGGLGKSVGILIISGTGSCVFGQNAHGEKARIGGWGHFLGDSGSGYRIGLLGLRSVIRHYDETQQLSPLGQRIFARLGFNQAEDAVHWMNMASKSDVAAVASDVFADEQSDGIIQEAAQELVVAATLAAHRLGFTRNDRWEACLSGGVFTHQPHFVEWVGRNLRKHFPRVKVVLPRKEGAYGALQLALGCSGVPGRKARSEGRIKLRSPRLSAPPRRAGGAGQAQLQHALTEQRNPRTAHLDSMNVSALVDAMLNEDETIVATVRDQREKIALATEWIIRAMKRGGRLFYVGAGTSGRLGVLDASECPPTFGVEPDRVQGIIAGGPAALLSSVEAAEDDLNAGAEALRFRGLSRHDIVCGISASGRTPFVLGALDFARRLGAKTVLLTFNPQVVGRVTHSANSGQASRGETRKRKAPAEVSGPTEQADIIIAPATGPEVLTGSTRLKAGTATKLILNMLTTISMIRLGKVRGNLMTSLQPISSKLRDRAIHIVMTLARCDRKTAIARLERASWNVECAIYAPTASLHIKKSSDSLTL